MSSRDDTFSVANNNAIDDGVAAEFDRQELSEVFSQLTENADWSKVQMKSDIESLFKAAEEKDDVSSMQDQLARARVELARVYEASRDKESLQNAFNFLLQDEKWSAYPEFAGWMKTYESPNTSAPDMAQILTEVKDFLKQNDKSFKKAFGISNGKGATQESSNAPITGGEYNNMRDGDYNPREVRRIQQEWTELEERYEALNNNDFKKIIASSRLRKDEIKAFKKCEESYKDMISAKQDYNNYMRLNQQLAQLGKKKNTTQADKDAKNQLDESVEELKNKYQKKYGTIEAALDKISLAHQKCHRKIKQKLQDAPRLLKNLRRLLDLSDRGVDDRTLRAAKQLYEAEDHLHNLLKFSEANITDEIRQDIQRTRTHIKDRRKKYNDLIGGMSKDQISRRDTTRDLAIHKSQVKKTLKKYDEAKRVTAETGTAKARRTEIEAQKEYQNALLQVANDEAALEEINKAMKKGAGGLGLSAR
jgi:hypothetical protein